jgi:hypothetical protein
VDAGAARSAVPVFVHTNCHQLTGLSSWGFVKSVSPTEGNEDNEGDTCPLKMLKNAKGYSGITKKSLFS